MSERREFFSVFLLVSAVMIITWALLPKDAFYTGDSGVKYLQVTNLLASRFSTVTLRYNGSDIDPTSALSPFNLRPSVYVKDGQGHALFPVAFAFISSLFYAVLGFAGLYVLPLGCGLGCMALAYAIARQFVPHRWALLTMPLCLLATPMCFYSLTFWEHTPGVCLFLVAVWLLLRCDRDLRQAAAAGLLLGAAVWLRSEALVLAVLLYVTALRYLKRTEVIKVAAATTAGPVVALAVFNKLCYGEWFGHVTRNLQPLYGEQSPNLMAVVNMRASWLWTSLLGINAPQPLPAEQVGWEQSFDVVMEHGANAPLEFLALVAVGGIAACSAIASSREREGGSDARSAKPPRVALGAQMGLLLLLAAVVVRYILTFPQDRSPLITVLKSGGVFTFSPFLAMVLLWPMVASKDWVRAPSFRWLFATSLAFALLMPLMAPNDGGIRYGARYLLPAIAVLAVQAVVVLYRLWTGWGRRGFAAVMVVMVSLSVVVQARGVQLLYHKKVFSRDFTAALMDSPSPRVVMTYWWIPFEVPQVLWDKKVHTASLALHARDKWGPWLVIPARQQGERSMDVVVLGKKDAFPPIPGAAPLRVTHVVHSFDTYFNVTILTYALAAH